LSPWVLTCAFAVLSASASPALFADGDETLGDLSPDFPLASGNVLLAAGVGIEEADSGTIELEVPEHVEVRQVLLYWGVRALDADDEIVLNGSTTVRGDLIGASLGVPASEDRVPQVHRADITDLELIGGGMNSVEVSGIDLPSGAIRNGVEIVVIGQDTRDDAPTTELTLRDGVDFAYVDYPEPFQSTERQAFTFEPLDQERTAELTLLVGDHLDMFNGDRRPSTLEIQVEGSDLMEIADPLSASDGDSWDTVVQPVLIPAGATRVEVQFFSETRTGSRRVPSSFYWFFSALNLPSGEDIPQNPPAKVGGTVFCDLDESGTLEEGEPGIGGIPVELDCPGSDVFAAVTLTTETQSDGTYEFTVADVPDSGVVCSVSVATDSPGTSGKTLTSDSPQATQPLTAGSQATDHDFGFFGAPPGELRFRVEEKLAMAGSCVNVRVLMTSPDPVEGFLVALRHDPVLLDLDSITVEGTVTESSGADFVSTELVENGGTIGVILDIQAPFEGNEIPPGVDMPIAIYRYCCKDVPPGGQVVSPLELVNGELGQPAKDNVVVVGGLSLDPEFSNGSVTCEAPGERNKPYFVCGGPTIGPGGLPVQPEGAPGDKFELCFYYCSPEDNQPGHAQFDHLQGISMALEYDCELTCLEDTFRVPEDSIATAIGADFVSLQCDGNPDDGDGCELLVAALAELEPPFEGTTFPPTSIPLKIACVDMQISPDAECGRCLPIEFRDGLNGPNLVPVKNLYSAENESFPADTIDCQVCVTGSTSFRRADCNVDGGVNIADSAATLSFLFPANAQESFDPPCMDACDSNDDGSVNIADVIQVLNWLFLNGGPPPPPGPEGGEDPTPDELSCEFSACDPVQQ